MLEELLSPFLTRSFFTIVEYYQIQRIMIKHYLFSAILLVVLCTGYSQAWKPVNSGTTEWLLAVSFPTAQTGYAVGWSGTILKTTDGGLNWAKQTSGSYNVLHSVCFISASTGYVAGEYGTILKTTDGGNHWLDISPGISEALLSIHFADANNGFAGGGAFVSTPDGGASWPVYQPFTEEWFSSVFFLTADTGFAASNKGRIYRTCNGGTSWLAMSNEAGILYSIYFVDSKLGYAVGENTYEQAIILKTENGGLTWDSQNFVFSPALSSVHFPVQDTGYAVGGNGMIFKTTDGGITWKDQLYDTPQWLTAVCFTDANNGIIAATGGLILKTTTGGVLGDQELSTAGIAYKIYPNPTQDLIYIEKPGSADNVRLSIIDSQGRNVMNAQLSGTQSRFDLRGLSPGFYMLRFVSDQKVVIRRILKE